MPAYPVCVLKAVGLVICLGGLAVACDEPEPTLVYHYEVRGVGESVMVSYLVDHEGLVDQTVHLPWASEELRGTESTPVRIEVNGPPGSRVRCVISYRPVGGSYGGNGSGSMKQWASPDEDQTVCQFDQSSLV